MAKTSSLRSEAFLVAKRANDLGLSQIRIAEAVGSSQSQVSRILSGKSLRRSRLFDDVCKYVNSIQVDGSQKDPSSMKELRDALGQVWDGTPQHARALAVVIRSLAALHPGNSRSA